MECRLVRTKGLGDGAEDDRMHGRFLAARQAPVIILLAAGDGFGVGAENVSDEPGGRQVFLRSGNVFCPPTPGVCRGGGVDHWS